MITNQLLTNINNILYICISSLEFESFPQAVIFGLAFFGTGYASFLTEYP